MGLTVKIFEMEEVKVNTFDEAKKVVESEITIHSMQFCGNSITILNEDMLKMATITIEDKPKGDKMGLQEWMISYYDELDPEQKMNSASIKCVGDPNEIVKFLHTSEFGWSEEEANGIGDCETSVFNKTNNIESWFIVQRNDRGHVLIVVAIEI